MISLTGHPGWISPPGVPSLSSADASRRPPARSMLLKLSTQKSYQPEVSADDRCVARGYIWVRVWNYANWKLPTVGCYGCSMKSVYFLKSSNPGSLSCPCQQRFLKSWRPLGWAELSWAELLPLKSYRGIHHGLACCLQPFLVSRIFWIQAWAEADAILFWSVTVGFRMRSNIVPVHSIGIVLECIGYDCIGLKAMRLE